MSEGERAPVYASGPAGAGEAERELRVYPSGLMRANSSSCELVTSRAGRALPWGVSALGTPPPRLQVHGGGGSGPTQHCSRRELALAPHRSGSFEVWVDLSQPHRPETREPGRSEQ